MVSIYNAEKKQLAAIFRSPTAGAKFIFGFKNYKDITTKAVSKKRIEANETRLGFPIAVRFTTLKQEELLGNEDYVIVDEDLKKRFKTIK